MVEKNYSDRANCVGQFALTVRGERRLRRILRSQRRQALTQITTQLNDSASRTVSKQTVQHSFHRMSFGSRCPMSEGRFDLSTFRSERTNEASTLTITPKRSSSRDVGTSSYRYHTATYPPASVSANRRTNDTIFVASM
ncbi:hypothetical protein TNCV_584671 [Trichonephila clavipes]|nr:hypothetical protein TNCV_584671 [Trichonephila clavipes]